nr:alpha/beta fold hydrolase [Neoroseomonas alba]
MPRGRAAATRDVPAVTEVQRGLLKTRLGTIHYRSAGRGEAVLLFHINQQSSALMLELIEELAPGFHVLAMDYPSHGMSDHVAEQPGIGDYADIALALMDAHGIARAHLIGEAVGSLVATDLAGRHPDRVSRVLLVNCPYLPGVPLNQTKGDVTAEHRPTDASGFPLTRTIDFVLDRDPAHSPMHPTQSWMDRINRAQIEAGRDRWQALDALRAYDLAAGLGRLRCPVRVLMGEHFYFLQYQDEMMVHLHGATLRVVPNGRFCVTWEHAAIVAQEARDFLRDTAH